LSQPCRDAADPKMGLFDPIYPVRQGNPKRWTITAPLDSVNLFAPGAQKKSSSSFSRTSMAFGNSVPGGPVVALSPSTHKSDEPQENRSAQNSGLGAAFIAY